MALPDPILFGKGALASRSRAYIYGSLASDDAAGNNVSVVLCWDSGAWQYWFVDARVCGIAVRGASSDGEVSALSIDGRVHVSARGQEHWDHLDLSPEGPNALRHATGLTRVEDTLLATGMGRFVYINSGGRQWRRMDLEMRVARSSPEVAGLKSIDGSSLDDLFAVGFGGEIWHFDGRSWKQLDSPTNVKLEAVKAVGRDDVFVAGAAGTVYRGGTKGWGRIANELTSDTFWSASVFESRLYLATSEGQIYSTKDNELVTVSLGLERRPSTRWLSVCDGSLLSVGIRDVLLFDGLVWRRIATPQDD
jgi:hypothetical protein